MSGGGRAEAAEPPAAERRPGAEQWVPSTGRGSIARLREAARDCRGCELYRDATQVVFSSGPARAQMALVGEQPGDVEDREGEPFVGPAGRLLRSALEDAGVAADSVYLTNTVKHFRFDTKGSGRRRIHRTPDLAHMTACRPWLDEELRVVDPQVVVGLGAIATRALLGRDASVTRLRGQLLERETPAGRGMCVVTLHPSAVLRMRGAERDEARAGLVADLRTAYQALGTQR